MRHPWKAVACAVALTGIAVGAQQPPPQPVFRSASDLVNVDVSVKDNAASLAGLTAADFVVLDNGVPQRVESLDASSLPVDVTLLLDESGMTRGAWTYDALRSPDDEIRDQTRRLAAALRPIDRIRVLTIDSRVTEVLPLQSTSTPRVFKSTPSGGLASVHEALIAAMLEPTTPDRRHFVVALTQAVDTLSVMSMVAVREVARRSDAVLHVVQDDDTLLKEDALTGAQTDAGATLPPTMRFWLAARRRGPLVVADRDFWHLTELQTPVRETAEPGGPTRLSHRIDVLKEAAALTGGAYHDAGFLASRDVVETFKDIFDDFRRGYVLRYSPQGVTREGWHEIKVTVPSRPGVVITARRGYAIEPTRPVIPRSGNAEITPRAGTVAPATAASLTALYERGAYSEMIAAIRASRDRADLVRDVRVAANPWPGQPGREAVFALEIAAATLMGSDARTERELADLLAKHGALRRHPVEADDFECAWYWVESVILEGAVRPAFATSYVERALERCPDEPRLHLAKAILKDQEWPVGMAGAPPDERLVDDPDATHVVEVTARYAKAMAFAEVAAEARVRTAWLAYRTGRYDGALALVADLDRFNPDRQIRYLAALVRGQALRQTDKGDEAIGAFRSALEIWPGAQSARVSLMTLLMSRGEWREAESLAEAIQSAPSDQFDPWWMYMQGDYWAYSAIIARLRAFAQ